MSELYAVLLGMALGPAIGVIIVLILGWFMSGPSPASLADVDRLLEEVYADTYPADPIYNRHFSNSAFDGARSDAMLTMLRDEPLEDGLSPVRCGYCGTRATTERIKVSGLCEHCGGPL